MKSSYTPETPFQIAPPQSGSESALVFNLKQDGWKDGKPDQVNDVEIRIHGRGLAPEALNEIATIVANSLNGNYPVTGNDKISIELTKLEGNKASRVCLSWTEASATLDEWGTNAPKKGEGYMKVSAKITFHASGLTYNYRLDIIQGGTEENRRPFYQNFVERLLTISGKKKPYHMSEENFRLMQSDPAIQEIAGNAIAIVERHFNHLTAA